MLFHHCWNDYSHATKDSFIRLFIITLNDYSELLTHWNRVTHICVGNLTIIGRNNGLSPGWRQHIIWINVGVLVIGHLATKFRELLIEILTLSLNIMDLKVSYARSLCHGLKFSMKIMFHIITSWYLIQNTYQLKFVCGISKWLSILVTCMWTSLLSR